MDTICNSCGSINDYKIIVKSNQHTAWCNGCGKYIKNIPQDNKSNLTMYVGKYKGKLISTIDDSDYLSWCLRSFDTLNEKYRIAIQERIDNITKN